MPKSNLAMIMKIYAVTPQMLSSEVGADITLISRWRTGHRRLVAGRRWVAAIAQYFIQLDAQQAHGPLIPLLHTFFPLVDLAQPENVTATLEKWLSAPDQCTDLYAERRERLIDTVIPSGDGPSLAWRLLNREVPYIAYSETAIKHTILDMLDKAQELPEPVDILIACPESFELLLWDRDFGVRLIDGLYALFARGFRLHAVLHAGCALNRIPHFSGRWLTGHLMGYIRSYCRTEAFDRPGVKLLAAIGDQTAITVQLQPEGDLTGELYYNLPQVADVLERLKAALAGTVEPFHYNYFRQPAGYLSAPVDALSNCYLFERLPHFGLTGDRAQDMFNLNANEYQLLSREFAPLLMDFSHMEPSAAFFHILCPEEIEAALDKPRHRVLPASDILGRRVYMTTQALVDQLVIMRRNLQDNPRYWVCFASTAFFNSLGPEFAVYGDYAAIGWVPGQRSAACRTPSQVAALRDYAQSLWAGIPGSAKTRGSAIKRIGAWLRRAKNFGYMVAEE